MDKPKQSKNRTFLHECLAVKIFMHRRTDGSCSFKRRLGFNLHGVINTTEQTVIQAIKEAFEGEILNLKTMNQGIGLIFIFKCASKQLKWMNMATLSEIIIMNHKEKKY